MLDEKHRWPDHARAMIDAQQILTKRARRAVGMACGQAYAELDPLVRPAAKAQFGDFQINVAMPLGKQLGQNPRQVAQRIVDHLDVADLGEVLAIAGPGFINIKLSGTYLAEAARAMANDDRLGVEHADEPQTVVIDYSGPNVAKEMHVGHLRSTVIGDALARTFDLLGHRVIRQNHLGDWGTQFGMLIEYMHEEGILARDVQPGDMHIQDLDAFYKRSKKRFDESSDFADRARKRVVALQSGDAQTLRGWRSLVEASKEHFNPIYARLGVTLRDDDIRGESAYNTMLRDVVDDLQRVGLLCESDGAKVVFVEGYDNPLIVQKSDGGYGYGTTDLAATRYRTQQLGATRIVYVVDARQADHFAMVFDVARRAGWLGEAVRTEHVRFGTILGEDGRPFKTRSGETVKLAALLDEAEQRAAAIVREKNPDLTPNNQQRVARVVGIGAVKYGDLSSDRVKDYVFAWDRMLAMDGNTAPYLQYAYARIRSIFRKAEVDPQDVPPETIEIDHEAERALMLTLMQYGAVVRSVADRMEPHQMCNWLYELATRFSGFYEQCPVLRAQNEAQRRSRLWLCELTARGLKHGLNLLGIEVLQRM